MLSLYSFWGSWLGFHSGPTSRLFMHHGSIFLGVGSAVAVVSLTSVREIMILLLFTSTILHLSLLLGVIEERLSLYLA